MGAGEQAVDDLLDLILTPIEAGRVADRVAKGEGIIHDGSRFQEVEAIGVG